MKIILIKDPLGRPWSHNLTRFHLFAGIACLVILPMLIGLATYIVSAQADRLLNPYVDPQYRLSVEERVTEQELNIERTRQYMQDHMDALGKKLGGLQAQVSQLNTTGKRIAKLAGIPLSKLPINQNIAVGGANPIETSLQEADIDEAIKNIEQQLMIRESELAAVDAIISTKNQKYKQIPAGWPVKGGWVSSKFGTRLHPITGKKHFHAGVDIPGEFGADVLAVAPGVVSRSEKNGNYGWMVEIDHGNGHKTRYAHNNKNNVSVGEAVMRGQVIAALGSTGRSTGPHVHFEVFKNNKRVNPIRYLYRKK